MHHFPATSGNRQGLRLGADRIPFNTLCMGAGSYRGIDYLQQAVKKPVRLMA